MIIKDTFACYCRNSKACIVLVLIRMASTMQFNEHQEDLFYGEVTEVTKNIFELTSNTCHTCPEFGNIYINLHLLALIVKRKSVTLLIFI